MSTAPREYRCGIGLTLVLLAASGCNRNVSSPFSADVGPLPENNTAVPAVSSGDPYPEQLSFATGSTGGYDWAHGRAFVHAPLAAVWAGMQDPAVWRDPTIASAEVTSVDATDESLTFVIDYVVHDLYTIEFDVTWLFEWVDAGDGGAVVMGRYQKTFGSSFIDVMEGSVVAQEPVSGVTQVDLVGHLAAPETGAGNIESLFRDFYQQLLAVVRDSPPAS
jgi:hypothetical protein